MRILLERTANISVWYHENIYILSNIILTYPNYFPIYLLIQPNAYKFKDTLSRAWPGGGLCTAILSRFFYLYWYRRYWSNMPRRSERWDPNYDGSTLVNVTWRSTSTGMSETFRIPMNKVDAWLRTTSEVRNVWNNIHQIYGIDSFLLFVDSFSQNAQFRDDIWAWVNQARVFKERFGESLVPSDIQASLDIVLAAVQTIQQSQRA